MTLEKYLSEKQETVAEFSARSGVSKATVKRIKQTGFARSAETIERIDKATGGLVSAADLLRLTKTKKSAA